jgi:RNA polymerase sigma-70 factor, ECF subfamily
MTNTPQPDDGELVRRTLAGDREAFAILFDRYARLVRAIAWDAGHDWASVQDLTQECFLRAYRQLATLRRREHFRYWLTGIARQLVRESRRRRQQVPLDHELAAADAERTALDDSDEIEHVLGLVSRLPEQERLAVRCFFLSGRNIADTAQVLDLSRSSAYEVIKRACTRLARWLGVCEPEERCEHELP